MPVYVHQIVIFGVGKCLEGDKGEGVVSEGHLSVDPFVIVLTIQFGKVGRVKKVISRRCQEGRGVQARDQWIDTFSCRAKKIRETMRSARLSGGFS